MQEGPTVADADIEITFVHPPIPLRDYDYQATLKGFDPEASTGPNSKVGHGRTAEAAKADLLDEIGGDEE